MATRGDVVVVIVLLLVFMVFQFDGTGTGTQTEQNIPATTPTTQQLSKTERMKEIAFVSGKPNTWHLAGLNGECDCPLRAVDSEQELIKEASQENTTILVVILDIKSQTKKISFPPNVASVIHWREAKQYKFPEFQKSFDILMSTHFTSNLLNPCHFPGDFKPFLPFREKPFSERLLIAAVTSDCKSETRNKFMDELSELLPLEIYGECGNGKTTFTSPPKGTDGVPEFISNFKFFLAVENTVQHGYVSEKIFKPLASGAVPIYYGAPNIEDFPLLDGKNKWYISTRDFPSPEALAAHILAVAEDEQLHQQYLQWRPYALAGGELFPDAPPSIKRCNKLFGINDPFDHDQVVDYRHQAICSLCDPDLVAEIVDEGFPAIPLVTQEELSPYYKMP